MPIRFDEKLKLRLHRGHLNHMTHTMNSTVQATSAPNHAARAKSACFRPTRNPIFNKKHTKLMNARCRTEPADAAMYGGMFQCPFKLTPMLASKLERHPVVLTGSVSFRAVQLRKFSPSSPALKLSPGQRGQSWFPAYATNAALRREHVGVYGISIVESFAVCHSRDSSVPLIQCSSFHASVDINS